MCNCIEIETRRTFVIRLPFTFITDMREAYKKYGIEFPLVEFPIEYYKRDGKWWYEFYSSYEDYGIRYHQFSVGDDTYDEVTEFIASMLIGNLDNMSWDEQIKGYLEMYDIDYEK